MVAGGFVLGIVSPARSDWLSHVEWPCEVGPAALQKQGTGSQSGPVLHPPARLAPGSPVGQGQLARVSWSVISLLRLRTALLAGAGGREGDPGFIRRHRTVLKREFCP